MNRSLPGVVLAAFPICLAVLFTTFCRAFGANTGQGSEQCSFPAFLLTEERWMTHISLERMAMRMEWTFGVNSATFTDRRVLPDAATLLYDCVSSTMAADGNTVLAKVFSSPEPSLVSQSQQLAASTLPSLLGYQCLRFVQRSSHVVQLLKSTDYLAYADENQCGDAQLVLDEYPLIWLRPDASVIVDAGCGIVGGYSFYLQPSSTGDDVGQRMCAVGPRPPVLESDCGGIGEGISIDFRDPSCMGELSLPITSRLRCIGTWTDLRFNFTFTVLTDGDRVWPKLWILRIPSTPSTGRALVGHISTEIATVVDAAMTPPSADNIAYAVHMSPTSFDTLCEDESVGCDATLCTDEDYVSGSLSEVYCQKTCNTCLTDSGDTWRCAFAEDARGLWHEASSDRGRANRLISIDNRTIVFGNTSVTSSQSTCVRLDRYSAVNSAPRRFPVVTVYPSTGCRPRYACVELTRRSDAVLTYRIGMTAQWPYVSWTTSYTRLQLLADILCDDSMFQTDLFPSAAPSLIGGVSIGEMRAVVLQQTLPLSSVQCNLQLNSGWLMLDGRLPAGARNKTAAVSQCGDGKSDQFTFTVIAAPSSSATDGDSGEQLSDDTHRCLATFTDSSTGDQYVITATDGAYYCWLFVLRPWFSTTRVYVTLASDCTRDIGDKIQFYGYTGYIAVFDVVTPSTQVAVNSQQALSVGLSRDCSSFTYSTRKQATTKQTTPGPIVSVQHRSTEMSTTHDVSDAISRQTQGSVRPLTAPTTIIYEHGVDTTQLGITSQVTVVMPTNGDQTVTGEQMNGSAGRSIGHYQLAIQAICGLLIFRLMWP
jgi:hypothetical protein